MALASLNDVKRILRLPEDDDDLARDAQMRAALDAIESWAETRLWHIAKAGQQVEVYFDVMEDASLPLPADDVIVTKVKVFEYPSSTGVPLSPIELGMGHGYDQTDNGWLILRPTLFVTPFEGASAQRKLRTYSRVEIFYQGTGVVPTAVTEGIAFLAAGYYTDGPRALRGLTGERIGDYSYQLGDLKDEAGQMSYVAQAMWFLTPFFKKARVRVI